MDPLNLRGDRSFLRCTPFFFFFFFSPASLPFALCSLFRWHLVGNRGESAIPTLDIPPARIRTKRIMFIFRRRRFCGARKPSPAGCFDLGECALNVNEAARRRRLSSSSRDDVSFRSSCDVGSVAAAARQNGAPRFNSLLEFDVQEKKEEKLRF